MPPSGYASIASPGRRSVRSWSGPGARLANVTWVVTVSRLGSPSVAGSSPSKAIGFGSTACMGRGWSGSPRTLARRSPVAWSRQVERCATRPVRKADTLQTRTPRSGNDRMDKASVGGGERGGVGGVGRGRVGRRRGRPARARVPRGGGGGVRGEARGRDLGGAAPRVGSARERSADRPQGRLGEPCGFRTVLLPQREG